MDTPNPDPERDWTEQAFDWLMVAGGAYLLARHAYPRPHPILLPAGLLLPLLGLGRLRQLEWASWGLIGFLAVLAGLHGWRLLHGAVGWWPVVAIPATLWFAWSEWRSIRRRRARRTRPLVSFVLLEREPRFLDPALLPQIVAAVWPGDYTGRGEEDPCFVVGEQAPFIVRSPRGLFIIHCVPQPYFDDPAATQEHTPDLRARQCLAENQAWLSVDWMGGADPQDEPSVYREIGKLAAALAGENTLALLHPTSGRYCPWNENTARHLADGYGLDVLTATGEPPVVPLAPDDKAIAAAAAEARRRWPEFAAAFATRHPEQLFSVKTALTVAGDTEHIWVEVDRIDGPLIHGRLGNDPVSLGGMRCQDPVTVPLEAVEDWIYLLSDRPVGGFSIAAVDAARRRIRGGR